MSRDILRSSNHDPEFGERILLTPKEINRASEEGYTIAVRPQKPGGGFLVMVVRVDDGVIRGREFVESRNQVPAATTSLLRDMDKYQGVGGNYSYSGRHRNKGVPALRASLTRIVRTAIQQNNPTAAPYKPGRKIMDEAEFEVGKLYIKRTDMAHFGHEGIAENLVRVTAIPNIKNPDRGKARIVTFPLGIYVNPRNPSQKRQSSDREFSIQIPVGWEEFYEAKK